MIVWVVEYTNADGEIEFDLYKTQEMAEGDAEDMRMRDGDNVIVYERRVWE
jgi:hypothetical protein